MTESFAAPLDPTRDLVLDRTVNVPRELVWKAWTVPTQLVQWFTPAPWKTVECEIDLRPGGCFRTVMESPDGQQYPNAGCFLDVVENERLVFTSGFGPGFRPIAPTNGADDLPFTATIALESAGEGTRYTATALHASAEAREKHEAMGFHDGWGKALDQLVAMIMAQ